MSLRRSQRAAVKAAGDASRDAISSVTKTEDSDDEKPPKRRKVSQSKKNKKKVVPSVTTVINAKSRGKRGILQDIKETPLDVIFEILCYLEPLDLLRMRRLTKDFHGLLTSKSTAHVWRCVRLGMNALPPIFDDINEIQYASLLFETYCHFCGKGPCKVVIWELRRRICKACAADPETGILTCRTLVQKFGAQQASILERLLPRYPLSNSRGPYFYLLSRCQAYIDALATGNAKRATNALPTQRAKLKSEYDVYDTWLSVRERDREDKLATLRLNRWKNIIERLKVDGWEADIAKLKSDDTLNLRNHKLVTKPQAMTDRIWLSIKPTITEAFTQMCMKKAIRERVAFLNSLLQRFLAVMPTEPVLPPDFVFSSLEPFNTIITKTPSGQDLTEKDFASGLNDLPRLCAEWRDTVEEDLLAILRKARHRPDLSLASTTFNCSGCTNILQYPFLVNHMCLRTTKDPAEGPDTWSLDCIEAVSEETQASIERYVTLSGLDPAMAMTWDMDNADVWFECRSCCSIVQMGLMRWRSAMQHDHDHDHGPLEKALEPHAIKAADLAEVRFFKKSLEGMVCMDCHVTVAKDGHRDHLSNMHNMSSTVNLADHFHFRCDDIRNYQTYPVPTYQRKKAQSLVDCQRTCKETQ